MPDRVPMIFRCLLFLVFLAPLPFGANRPWAWNLWTLAIALLAIAWAVQALSARNNFQVCRHLPYIKTPILAFFLVGIWVLFQSHAVGPTAWSHPFWAEINAILGTQIQPKISLHPVNSVNDLIRLTGYALVFWLSFYYCQDRNRAQALFRCMQFAALAYSSYALIIHMGGYENLLQHPLQGSSLTGTFVNSNHFATYIGLTLLCTLAVLYQEFKSLMRSNASGYYGLQYRLEKLIQSTWLSLLTTILALVGLTQTHSIGAMLSFTVACLVLTGVLAKRSVRTQQHPVLFIILLGTAGLLLFTIFGESLLLHLNRLGGNRMIRPALFSQVLQAIASRPWTGFGYGCFEEAFTLFKNSTIAGTTGRPVRWDYAHNSYLEILLELGIPAGSLLLIGLINLPLLCIKGIRNRKRDVVYPATGLACSILVGLHALVDFSIQIPAVAYTYMLVMGTACAQSFSSRLARQPSPGSDVTAETDCPGSPGM